MSSLGRLADSRQRQRHTGLDQTICQTQSSLAVYLSAPRGAFTPNCVPKCLSQGRKRAIHESERSVMTSAFPSHLLVLCFVSTAFPMLVPRRQHATHLAYVDGKPSFSSSNDALAPPLSLSFADPFCVRCVNRATGTSLNGNCTTRLVLGLATSSTPAAASRTGN